jgi:hypothetical protein
MNNPTIISIIVALTAAITSLIVAVVNHFSTKKNTHNLETFKTKLTADLTKELDSFRADLAEKQAENNARRDYLYEARKRLYQQYEPLLFQLVELSESTLKRVHGLARTAKQGNLGPHHIGWLSPYGSFSGYYEANTIYRFLAPLVIIKLIQRGLTLVDLTVDPHINNQYSLAQWLYNSFTLDFTLASMEPSLEYDPNHREWQEKQKTHPEKYWKQGIMAGRLDNAVEVLIVREPHGIVRCMSFGEFEDVYNGANTNAKFDAIRDIFMDFHPKTRPVLWRILIAQAHIYQALLRTREMKIISSDESLVPKLLKPISEVDRLKFDWRRRSEEATDEEVLSQPFEAAYAYLRESLGSHFAV